MERLVTALRNPPAGREVVVHHVGGVMGIVINRPDVRNALRLSTWRAIAGAFSAASAETRGAVIVGSGDSFCAGGDFTELVTTFDSQTGINEFRDVIAQTFRAISDAPFPVIAAVDGAAMGGGAEIALACDLRIATPRARFAMPGTRFGLALNAAEIHRVVRLVGPSKASYWLTTGETVDAATAVRWGLVDEVVPNALGRAAAIAYSVCETSAEVASWTKRVIEGRNVIDQPQGADAVLLIDGLQGSPLKSSRGLQDGAK